MSTNDKDKNAPVEADWDSAVDVWDKDTVNPSPAQDKTPAPKPAEASRTMPEKPDDPKQTPMDAFDDVVDEDSTVIAPIPQDLLADSLRGTSGAAGLGQMFGRKDDLIPITDDAVVTSAADIAVPSAEPARGAPRPPAPAPKEVEHAVEDGELFDPFSDLRDKPAPRPPRPPPPPRPPVPRAAPPPVPAKAAPPTPAPGAAAPRPLPPPLPHRAAAQASAPADATPRPLPPPLPHRAAAPASAPADATPRPLPPPAAAPEPERATPRAPAAEPAAAEVAQPPEPAALPAAAEAAPTTAAASPEPAAEAPAGPPPSVPGAQAPVGDALFGGEPESLGPKLHEPPQRVFSTDDETAVLSVDEVNRELEAVRRAGEISGEAKTDPPPALPAQEPAVAPPPARAQSIPPPPLPAVKPQWPDERDCAGHLLDRGQRDAWAHRAAWLAEEARANQDQAERSSTFLVVSELHAMLADDEQAEQAARQAREGAVNHPLVQRQLRAGLLRDRDWTALVPLLEAETRVAPTAEARAHGALMHAEIQSRVQGEPDSVGKLLDLAARVLPQDPRAHLEKFVRGIAQSADTAPKLHVPDGEALAPLAQACKDVTRIRLAAKGGSQEQVGPYEVIPQAHAALLAFDTSGAAKVLRSLDDVRGLGPGAAWLSASLAAQSPAMRSDAAQTYKDLSNGPHAAIARRLRAMRAVELGDRAVLDDSLEAGGSDAFSAVDRASLAALFGTDPEVARPFIKSVLDQSSTMALGAAATCALEPVTSGQARVSATVGEWEARAAVAAGRAVLGLSGDEEFSDRVATMREKCAESEVARLLQLESDLRAGRKDAVIAALAQWQVAGAEGERDRSLAAGLAAEVLGDKARAREEYERALAADAANEPCSRVLASLDDKEAAAARLVELAKSTQEETKAAMLLVEASAMQGPDSEEYDSRLRRAHELAPSLPFASFLGEHHARARQDKEGTLEWLRARREATEDPVEAAFDQCREAMLLVDRDAPAAANLLEAASKARPSDMALRELFERFSPDRPEDWASWRVSRAAELQGADRARLLLQAALGLEREGNLEEAGKLARQAAEGGGGGIAQLTAERAEFAGLGSTAIADTLLEQARSETNTVRERREAQERLASLDEFGRGDVASAMLWHRAILEESPQHLPSLRRLEQAFIGDGREEDYEPVAAELARCLMGPESDGHAMVAARIRLRESSWSATRELVEAAASQTRPSLWALRETLAHCRAESDEHGLLRAATALAERADRDTEASALLMFAADAHERLGEHRVAAELMATALQREPRLFDAHLRFADMLKAAGDHARAAEELEAIARKSAVSEHRIELWYRAAVIWTDEVKDVARGRKALEEASDLDIAYEDVFQRLQAIYTSAGDRTELAALLERRLEAITDPEERVEMEVLRGKALADVGELGAAKEALSAALDASPDHVPALEAFARLCADEDDWGGAEQALIRLARHVPDAARQADIYQQLGEIYVNHLPNLERAELVLLEVLKRRPDDSEAQSRLVDVYRESGDSAKAIELCTGLLQRATTPEQKRSATIQLALIHEQVEGDLKKAETMLEKAHKEWSTSVEVLRALAQFHQRRNHAPALKMLLDRSANDARRSLSTGRFNPELFSVLSAVGELRGKQDAALVAGAAIGALEGNAVEIGAGGAAVFKTELDDLIAPPILTESLRNLLKAAGDVLENAFPIDLKAIRAGKFPPNAAQLEQAVQNTGAVFGLEGLEVFVSPAIGPTCIPIGSSPPRIVLGASLVAAAEEDVRDFLILRALKILQVRGSVLSRTAPIDLLPVVTALVKSLSPSFNPASVDPKRFEDAKGKIAQHLPSPLPPSLGALAVEVGGSIDNRISTLNVAINSWGSRAALLASGSMVASIKGIAWAGGHPSGPPVSGQERVTWIGRNAEARELVVFTVSDAFLESRIRLGISEDQ